mgnify:FL=1
MENKEIPDGVKVVSVLYFIASFFGIIFGAILTFIAIYPNRGFSTFLLIPIIIVLISFVSLFASLSLRKGKNWARIFTIIFFFIPGFLPAYIFSFGAGFSGNYVAYYFIVGSYIIVSLWIMIYLFFNKKVKEFFGR